MPDFPPRPGWDEYFMEIAKVVALRSNCCRRHVAAVIVKDGRIISTGYNGTPVGFQNCEELFRVPFDRAAHHEFSARYEIHAEINALLFAARNGIAVEGADIYCTMHPCDDCIKALCNSGVKTVYYQDEYDRYEGGNRLVDEGYIRLVKLDDGQKD